MWLFSRRKDKTPPATLRVVRRTEITIERETRIELHRRVGSSAPEPKTGTIPDEQNPQETLP